MKVITLIATSIGTNSSSLRMTYAPIRRCLPSIDSRQGQLPGTMTAHEVLGRFRFQLRRAPGALIGDVVAARVKVAAVRRRGRVGHLAGQHDLLVLVARVACLCPVR